MSYDREENWQKKSGKGLRKKNVRKVKNAKTLKKDEETEKEKMHRGKNFAEFSFYIGKIWRYRVQSHI
jgi:hypothetical protein